MSKAKFFLRHISRKQQVDEILDELECEREIDALCIQEDKIFSFQVKVLPEWQ